MVPGHRKVKRQKTVDLKPIVFVKLNTSRNGKSKPLLVRALLNSGGSRSLITSEYAQRLRCKPSREKVQWSTPAGIMNTSVQCKALFSIPELHDNRHVTFEVHVTPTLGNYDMILGRDFLRDMKINLKFDDETIQWDHVSILFKDIDGTILDSYHVQEPNLIATETQRLQSILDAKYEPANLNEIVEEAKHLNTEEQQMLFDLLDKYKDLFDSTLGTWNGTEHEVELKEGVQPYHAKGFPIPRIHYAALRLEVERLVKLGVLRQVNRSEWAAPTFIIPKKDGTVRFISDFRELNKRIRSQNNKPIAFYSRKYRFDEINDPPVNAIAVLVAMSMY